MALRKIQFEQGKIYHIYNRGVNRQPIFVSQENYRFLLLRVNKYTSQLSICVHAFCLMPNHFHFVFQQNGSHTINKCMQLIFNSYSKALNKWCKRTGPLFEGPFKAVEVDSDDYFIHLCRYIHRNPLEAGLVKNIEDWKFSNYIDWIEEENGVMVHNALVKSYFPEPKLYKDFVCLYSGKGKYAFEF